MYASNLTKFGEKRFDSQQVKIIANIHTHNYTDLAENDLLYQINRLVNSQKHTYNPISMAEKVLLCQVHFDNCLVIQL